MAHRNTLEHLSLMEREGTGPDETEVTAIDGCTLGTPRKGATDKYMQYTPNKESGSSSSWIEREYTSEFVL